MAPKYYMPGELQTTSPVTKPGTPPRPSRKKSPPTPLGKGGKEGGREGEAPAERAAVASNLGGGLNPATGGRIIRRPKKVRGETMLWGGQIHGEPDTDNVAFCAGRDVSSLPMADADLLPYDLWGSTAHAVMLCRTGILSKTESRRLLKGLQKIGKEFDDGTFQLDPDKEDVHTNIEHSLTEKCGPEVAGKIHIGRSRNDQAATAMRLYLRDTVLGISRDIMGLVSSLLRMARDHTLTVMPGFSHRQHAAVSTFGHLLCSYAQALSRDLDRLAAAYDFINRSPLGAVAGYGTSWPIDRLITASYLGFEEIERNALDAVSNRGEMEAELAATLSLFMNHVSRMAQDVIFFSTPEAGMIRLPDAFVTGSSIMPQKRNPDFAEVIQAKTAVLHGCLCSLLDLARGGMSGYNRELQWTKYLIMDTIREVQPVPGILSRAMQDVKVNKERMAELANQGFLNAVDVADFLSRERKLSFRRAHDLVGRAVRDSEKHGVLNLDVLNRILKAEKIRRTVSEEEFRSLSSAEDNLKRRESTGSPHPKEMLATANRIYTRLRLANNWLKNSRKEINTARRRLEQARKRLGC